jgi:hypothetical protein
VINKSRSLITNQYLLLCLQLDVDACLTKLQCQPLETCHAKLKNTIELLREETSFIQIKKQIQSQILSLNKKQ